MNSYFLLSQGMLCLSWVQLFPPTPPSETTLHQLVPFFTVCLQPLLPINSYACSVCSRMPSLEPMFLSLSLQHEASLYLLYPPPNPPLPTLCGLTPQHSTKITKEHLAVSYIPSWDTPFSGCRIPPSWVFSPRSAHSFPACSALFCPSPKCFYFERFL